MQDRSKTKLNITIKTNLFPRESGGHFQLSLIYQDQNHNPLMEHARENPHWDRIWSRVKDRKREREIKECGGQNSSSPCSDNHFSSFAELRRGPLKSGLLNYQHGIRETLSWLQVPLWYRACWPFPHHTGPLCASLNGAWRKQHKGQRSDGSPFPKLFVWLWHV